ncbi:MAG: hypothetical protein AABW83_03035 [Nanoarchaeota archaeon]
MKKSLILCLLFLIFLFSFSNILAIEIIYSKDSYQPQELFQAQITGNFISLNENNIFIYKEGKVHAEPVIKGLTKQKDTYYFYTILPNYPGNFTLRIKDASYLERGIIKNELIVRPLIIELKNQSDLYINPGFIIPKDDFSIKVKSLYKNTEISAKFEATGEEKKLFLTEQIEETLNFKLPKLPSQNSKLIINNYEIPVFLVNKFEPIYEIEFIPNIIEGTIISNSRYDFVVVIRNPTGKNLENIILSSDINVSFNPSKIEFLESNKTTIVNLTITIDKVEEKFSGKIKASTNNKDFYLPIKFIITKNETEIKVIDSTNPTNNISTNILSCSQIGNICNSDETCNGDTINSLEGNCCIGLCEEKSSESYSKIIGIILIIVLILMIIYIIIKIRRKRNLESPEDILEEKKSRYKRRMEGKEVSGKLDNI